MLMIFTGHSSKYGLVQYVRDWTHCSFSGELKLDISFLIASVIWNVVLAEEVVHAYDYASLQSYLRELQK